MNRKRLIAFHLYLAAFFAPFVIVIAISGGLYLIGVKGKADVQKIHSTSKVLDPKSKSLKKDVEELLTEAGVTDYTFEYVKVKGKELYTRPTSTDHYIIKLTKNETTVSSASPNLVKRIVELHKGHGPLLFKNLQRIIALGLVIVILSGLALGLTAPTLRRATLISALSGMVLFFLLLL